MAETVTDANGVVWRKTQGGHWRDDKTGKLFSGSGSPAAGAGASGNQSAEFQQELARAKENLQAQVGTNGITQAQADAQYEIVKGMPLDQIRAQNMAAQASTGSPNAPDLPQSRPFGPVNGIAPLADNAPYNTPTDITNIQDVLNQQNISRQEALNRPGEITPFGTSQYIQNPDGTVTRVSSIGNINPMTALGWQGEQYQNQSYIDRALQAIAGEGGANNQGQSGLLPQLRGMFSSALDFSKAPAAPDANGYQADRQKVEDSLYNRFATVNEPQFKKQLDDFYTRQSNLGRTSDMPAYQREYEQLQRAQNDARDAARTQAISMGGQEQQRLFENTNNLRGNSISEMLTQRNQPLTDLRGLLSAVNPLQMPQFNQTANINVPQTNFAGTADNFLTRDANLESAKLGFANQLALANLSGEQAAQQQQQGFQNQQALNNQNFDHQQQLLNQQNGGSGGFWGQLGGGFLSGLTSGAGNAFGQWLFK